MVKPSSLLKENKLSLNKTYKKEEKDGNFLIFWCPLIFLPFSDLALEHAAFF